jgi:hypothetical protein
MERWKGLETALPTNNGFSTFQKIHEASRAICVVISKAEPPLLHENFISRALKIKRERTNPKHFTLWRITIIEKLFQLSGSLSLLYIEPDERRNRATGLIVSAWRVKRVSLLQKAPKRSHVR